MNRMTAGAVLVPALALGACDDGPITPEEIAGDYALVQAYDTALPVIVRASESCDTYLVDGTLSLESNGSFTLILDQEEDCSRAGGSTLPEQRSYGGSFALNGASLTFAWDAGGEAPFAGSVDDGRVTVDVTDPGASAAGSLPLTFERDS